LLGKHAARIDGKDGALIITWGNIANSSIKHKVLILRPAFVDCQPTVPIAWVCAAAPIPKGIMLTGADATDMPAKYVPIECQARSATVP
jgi:type IV pilus assembly protein PilA